LFSGFTEPFYSLRPILRHAFATEVAAAEKALSIDVILFG